MSQKKKKKIGKYSAGNTRFWKQGTERHTKGMNRKREIDNNVR